MKWLFLLPGFLLLTALSARAQRIKLFRSIIHTTQGERIDGILYDVTDSTVRYVPNQGKSIQQLRAGQQPTVFNIHQNTIDRIVIRRKGHVGRGLLIAGGTGLAIGLISALAPPPKTIVGALGRIAVMVGAPTTGIVCGTVASVVPYKVKRIRGNAQTHQSIKDELWWLLFIGQQQ